MTKIDDAASFLKALQPGGPWAITAITDKGAPTRTFRSDVDVSTGRHLLGCPDFIKEHNGTANLYYQLNPVRHPITKKASREDIDRVIAFHVDLDPEPGFPVDEEQARILGLLTTDLPKGVPEPSLIVFSGGGYQAIWLLDEPIHIGGDLGLAEDAKLYNMHLEWVFGADACHNIDRVLRLPFTMNIPGAAKRAKGRSEAMATLLKGGFDVRYPLSDFRKASGAISKPLDDTSDIEITNIRVPDGQELLDKGVDPRVLDIIVKGYDPENPKEHDNSRSAWVFDVACNLHRAGIETGVIVGALTNPEWKISDSMYRDIDGKPVPNPVGSACRQVRRALGYVERADKEEEDARSKTEIDNLFFMNDRHAVLLHEGGKCRVLTWDLSEVDDDRLVSMTQSFEDIRNGYVNRKVTVEKATQKGFSLEQKGLGHWWLEHPDRETFHALRFDPSSTDRVLKIGNKEYLNLWRGFGVDPVAGDWSKMNNHILKVLARGEKEHADYILRWAAWTLQNPDRPAEVALVFKGGKGTGKGFFGRTMRRLLGQHGLQISSKQHLTGRFNAHMRDCVLLFADEAIAPNDKEGEAVLKALITEDTLAVEGKGSNLITAPNRMHLIMASNEEFVVPATQDERRYAVFNVAPKTYDRTENYFKALDQELENGGCGAMLHHLLNLDLGNWHPRQCVPQTQALIDQKMENLTPADQWILGILMSGQIPGEIPTGKSVPACSISARSLYNEMRESVPDFKWLKTSEVRLARIPADWGAMRGSTRNNNFWTFLPLGDMRAMWDECRWPMNWPEPDRWAGEVDPDDAQMEVPF